MSGFVLNYHEKLGRSSLDFFYHVNYIFSLFSVKIGQSMRDESENKVQDSETQQNNWTY